MLNGDVESGWQENRQKRNQPVKTANNTNNTCGDEIVLLDVRFRLDRDVDRETGCSWYIGGIRESGSLSLTSFLNITSLR